jgi:hypothetical protein
LPRTPPLGDTEMLGCTVLPIGGALVLVALSGAAEALTRGTLVGVAGGATEADGEAGGSGGDASAGVADAVWIRMVAPGRPAKGVDGEGGTSVGVPHAPPTTIKHAASETTRRITAS